MKLVQFFESHVSEKNMTINEAVVLYKVMQLVALSDKAIFPIRKHEGAVYVQISANQLSELLRILSKKVVRSSLESLAKKGIVLRKKLYGTTYWITPNMATLYKEMILITQIGI